MVKIKDKQKEDKYKPEVVRLDGRYKVASPYEEKFTINYPAGLLMLNTCRFITFDELFKYLPNAVIRHDPDNLTNKYKVNNEKIKPTQKDTSEKL